MPYADLITYAQRYELPPGAFDALVEVVDRIVRSSSTGEDLFEHELRTLPAEGQPLDHGATGLWFNTLAGSPVALPESPRSPDAEVSHVDTPASMVAGYEMLGPIGEGGMGEVYRVRDRALNRVMALKVIRAERMEQSTVLARFMEEAQVTAQLQHPGIVPVHELGRLPDGRVFFTMPEVHGDTLGTAIDDVHEASSADQWRQGELGWTFRRLVSVFAQVCEAVAYAHSRGVVHRDLKPANIMVGEHGVVRVLDWGVAKVTGRRDLTTDILESSPVVTDRRSDGTETRVGVIVGTLAYMPPEQARGQRDRIDARSDVYALGAVLYELLTGRPPYEGSDALILLDMGEGPPPPPETVMGVGRPQVPEPLAEISRRAMARNPKERFADAGALAHAITDWLDGVRRREQAMELVEEAAEAFAYAKELRHRADALAHEGETALEGVPSWAPEEDKAPGWATLDEAHAVTRSMAVAGLRAEILLHNALTHDSSMPEARVALAARYQQEHRGAEAARDIEAAARAELNLRAQLDALPGDHVVRRSLSAYLEGAGRLSLTTDPPGAQALLYRYVLQNRRLVEVFERELGETPIVSVPLPIGSYLVVMRMPGRAEVRYPIQIDRQAHWDGVPPNADVAGAVHLPAEGALTDDDIYVPEGWFWSGGDPNATMSLPRRRLWADGLVIQRHPVTNGQYIAFLNDLVAQGRADEALRHVPRERGVTDVRSGSIVYGRDEAGVFLLRPDAEGDIWESDWPVFLVDWYSAIAYASWWSELTGQPWSLPRELVWEKAARGVDGRFFPWGDFLDPSWCCMLDSHEGRPLPASVDNFLVDSSPYGVRGMGGNIREWCADEFGATESAVHRNRIHIQPPGQHVKDNRVLRGGAWHYPARLCHAADRLYDVSYSRGSSLGFRLARPMA